MKAVVAAFNQEKALVGAFSVITNLRMEVFEALVPGPLRLAGLVHPRPDVRAGRVLRQVDTRTHNSPDDPVPCVFQVRSPRLLPPPVLPGGPAGEVREAG